MPVYNSETTIRQSVLSVLDQSHKNFEFIIINDGSNDRTIEIIREITDKRIHIFTYPRNGIAAARNKGIKLAKGEYITFIDADDLWMPDKLKDQLATLEENPDCKVVYSWVSIIDDKGYFLRTVAPMHHRGDVYADMLERCFIVNSSNLMFHRAVISGVGYFDESLKWAQDFDFNIRLAKKNKFALCPCYHIFYRQSAQSHSARVRPVEKYLIRVINTAFVTAPKALLPIKKRALSYNYQHIANKFIDTRPGVSSSFSAFNRLIKAVEYCPQKLFSISFWGIAVKGILNFIFPLRISRKLFKMLYDLETKKNKNWDLENLDYLVEVHKRQ